MIVITSTKKIVLGLLKGTVIAQFLSILMLPLVTRYYGPEQMALLYVVGNIIIFTSPLIMLRLEQSYLMANKAFKSAIVSAALQILFPASVFAGCFFWYFYFKSFGFSWLFPVILVVYISGLYQLLRQIALSEQNSKVISNSLVFKTLSKYLFLLCFALFSVQNWILISSEIISAAIATMIIIVSTGRTKFKLFSLKKLCLIIKRYSDYTRKDMFSALINSFLLAVQIPIISHIYGLQAVGLFGFAMQLVSLPNYHVGKAISDSLFTVAGRLVKEHKIDELLKLYDKSVLILLFGSVAIYGVIFISAGTLIQLFFSSEWLLAIDIIKALCIWMAFALISSPSMRIFVIIGQSSKKGLMDIFNLGLVIIVSFISYKYQYGFGDYLILLTIVRSAGYLIYIVSARYYIWSLLRE